MFKKIMYRIKSNPKKLFLIDGLGALLSAFLLGVVLVKLEQIIGIPPPTLYLLAALPIFFAIYDFFCYQNGGARLGIFLKGIAIMNLVYCFLSLGFAFYHSETITKFGWSYILLEIIVVSSLAIVELKMAKRWTDKMT